MVNNCVYNVQTHYVKIALYIFLQKSATHFFSCWIARLNMQKNYNNDNLQIKKSRIAHLLCQFVLLFIAAVGQIRVSFFFAILSFTRMAKNHFVPHGRIASHFPKIQKAW